MSPSSAITSWAFFPVAVDAAGVQASMAAMIAVADIPRTMAWRINPRLDIWPLKSLWVSSSCWLGSECSLTCPNNLPTQPTLRLIFRYATLGQIVAHLRQRIERPSENVKFRPARQLTVSELGSKLQRQSSKWCPTPLLQTTGASER